MISKTPYSHFLLTAFTQCFAFKPQQTFLPMIWIFTEGEGDVIEVIEPRIPFKIFSTLVVCSAHAKEHE